jgi:oligoribonuclease
MKYLSIDIETTGLDSESCQILSIGAIFEDTEKNLPFEEIPKFHVGILHEQITGSPFAINMNKDLIESIVHYQSAKDQDEKNDLVHMKQMKFLHKDEVVESFYDFLYDCGLIDSKIGDMVKSVNGKVYPILTSKMKPISINVAGKNFSTFDKIFLEKLPRWKQAIRIKQRILDPAILFIDWKEDKSLPSLDQCKQRANIDGIVTHNALEDAWDVVQLLRKFY